tara:strand:+ start:232 stop:447 length:216 start_codon:yes stop_codon:yes gene_type:complete
MKELNKFRKFINEEDDRILTGQSKERQEQALEDLQMAIEELEMSGVFDDGNSIVQAMLNKAYKMLSKKYFK